MPFLSPLSYVSLPLSHIDINNFFPNFRLKNLRISSLLCLQNLYNCLSCEDLGGKEVAYNVWSTLGQQVFKEPQDTMILEPSTSLMRAALEHIKTNPELFQQLTLSDIEVRVLVLFLQLQFSNFN